MMDWRDPVIILDTMNDRDTIHLGSCFAHVSRNKMSRMWETYCFCGTHKSSSESRSSAALSYLFTSQQNRLSMREHLSSAQLTSGNRTKHPMICRSCVINAQLKPAWEHIGPPSPPLLFPETLINMQTPDIPVIVTHKSLPYRRYISIIM